MIVQIGDNNTATTQSCTHCPQQQRTRSWILKWLSMLTDRLVNLITPAH
jgi:hypothetical protein